MKLCLSSLLLAAATTVSMADPTVSNDKNLRALRAEDVRDGHGLHGGHGGKGQLSTGCAVTVKMMGYMGLAGGKWDKIMSKACPGMSWGSHLASTGVCTNPTTITRTCGNGLVAGDSYGTISCFEMPEGSELYGVRMFILPFSQEDAHFALDDNVRLMLFNDMISTGTDTTSLIPVATQSAPIYYPSGWNTVMFEHSIQVTGSNSMCVEMRRWVSESDDLASLVRLDMAHSSAAMDFYGGFSTVVSTECPLERLREVDQGTLCMEVLGVLRPFEK